MPSQRQLALIAVLNGLLLSACVAPPEQTSVAVETPAPAPAPVPDPATIEVKSAIALLERAEQSSGEEWIRLHQVLASAAVMNPQPALRARVALALGAGKRSLEELERALVLSTRLLEDDTRKSSDPSRQPLTPQMRQLIAVQRAAVTRRIEAERTIATLQRNAMRARTRLSHESAQLAKARNERDTVQSELAAARQQLRAVTRIELKHESSGG